MNLYSEAQFAKEIVVELNNLHEYRTKLYAVFFFPHSLGARLYETGPIVTESLMASCLQV